MPTTSSPAEETLAQLHQSVKGNLHIGIYADVLYPVHAIWEPK